MMGNIQNKYLDGDYYMIKSEIIIGSGGFIVLISLGFPWIHIPYGSVTGWNSEGAILLAAIAYPVLASYYLINGVNKIWGFISIGGGYLYALTFLVSTILEPGAAPASGLYIAVFGLAVVIWGIIKDNQTVKNASAD